MKRLLIISLLFGSLLFAQEYERNVLVEVFTNSHCPLCPPAHNAIDAYLSNGTHKQQVRYIFYHIRYPYSDDPLFIASTEYSDSRNQYYGPFTSTPRGFFDGQIQSNSYNNWDDFIDARAVINTPIKIELSGTKDGSNVSITADITMSQNTPGGDLVIQFVVVEDVSYTGRNAISYHKNVMRAMFPSANGKSISVSANQTITESFVASPDWSTEDLSVVVFIQNTSTKEVYQSEWIDYTALTITDVADESTTPTEFQLYQNYPNPFNPTTTIKYNIPLLGGVRGGLNTTLKIYDILGTEIATLVNETKASGTHEVLFDASGLTSGIYFYKLQYGEFTATKKLTLIK